MQSMANVPFVFVIVGVLRSQLVRLKAAFWDPKTSFCEPEPKDIVWVYRCHFADLKLSFSGCKDVILRV